MRKLKWVVHGFIVVTWFHMHITSINLSRFKVTIAPEWLTLKPDHHLFCWRQHLRYHRSPHFRDILQPESDPYKGMGSHEGHIYTIVSIAYSQSRSSSSHPDMVFRKVPCKRNIYYQSVLTQVSKTVVWNEALTVRKDYCIMLINPPFYLQRRSRRVELQAAGQAASVGHLFPHQSRVGGRLQGKNRLGEASVTAGGWTTGTEEISEQCRLREW